MKREVVVLGVIILVVGLGLALYPERTDHSLRTEKYWGDEPYHVTYPRDFWHPYKWWGVMVVLVGSVTLFIGWRIPAPGDSKSQ